MADGLNIPADIPFAKLKVKCSSSEVMDSRQRCDFAKGIFRFVAFGNSC